MIYAVNTQGVAALRKMATSISDTVDEVNSLTQNVEAVADENNDALGPHKSSLDEVLENIREELKRASDPINNVSEILNEIADDYDEIIGRDRLKGLGK